MIKKKEPLQCPKCNEVLNFLMPDGQYLYCNKCNKFYKNNEGKVGRETSEPELKDNIYY